MSPRRRAWQTALIISAVAITFITIALASVVPFSSETARAKLVAVLSDQLDSQVRLDSLRLRLLPRFRAEGAGLAILRDDAAAPLISVKHFYVEGDVLGLLRRHIAKVSIDGLDIEIPPDADQDNDRGDAGAHKSELPRTLIIDELVTADGRLAILPRKTNKNPKVWAIHTLRMRSVGFGKAMPFDATLTNAVPPGEIVTHGRFGPWLREDPGKTPLDGDFRFDQADLSVFKGVAGTLSARGTFAGMLERIDIHGNTETPAFTITHANHPVLLHARYHTIVDGTNGDTILERIDASFLDTSLVATGSVIDVRGVPGRTVTLNVTMDNARIEDVLKLAVKGDPQPLVGGLSMRTAFVLPPGKKDVVEKLELNGAFTMTDARFTNAEVQRKINELSARSLGNIDTATFERVTSDFKGRFRLANGRLTIPEVTFNAPGSVVRLAGTYDLVAETVDFNGTLFMQAKVSQTTSGFKSVLLKIIDPLFKAKGGGSAVPIRITGSRHRPSFGLDKGRVFKK